MSNAGSTQADFEQVYRQYFDEVYYYILAMCSDHHIAEEITQESFFKAMKSIKSFRGESSIKT